MFFKTSPVKHSLINSNSRCCELSTTHLLCRMSTDACGVSSFCFFLSLIALLVSSSAQQCPTSGLRIAKNDTTFFSINPQQQLVTVAANLSVTGAVTACGGQNLCTAPGIAHTHLGVGAVNVTNNSSAIQTIISRSLTVPAAGVVFISFTASCHADILSSQFLHTTYHAFVEHSRQSGLDNSDSLAGLFYDNTGSSTYVTLIFPMALSYATNFNTSGVVTVSIRAFKDPVSVTCRVDYPKLQVMYFPVTY